MSDLQTLFDRDPLSLSSADLDSIVAFLRQQRKNFIAQGEKGKVSTTAKKAEAANLLSDLGL